MSIVLRHLATRVPYVGLGLAIAWLTGRAPDPPPRAFHVPPGYAFLYDWSLEPASEERLRARLPVLGIELERTPCYGTCPAYRLALTSDGRAEYEGLAFTRREGRFEGEVPLGWYATLAFATERIHFEDLRASYSVDVTDLPTTIVTVTRAGGRRIRVSDYGSQGPPELWLLTEAIDAVAEQIAWTEAPRE